MFAPNSGCTGLDFALVAGRNCKHRKTVFMHVHGIARPNSKPNSLYQFCVPRNRSMRRGFYLGGALVKRALNGVAQTRQYLLAIPGVLLIIPGGHSPAGY